MATEVYLPVRPYKVPIRWITIYKHSGIELVLILHGLYLFIPWGSLPFCLSIFSTCLTTQGFIWAVWTPPLGWHDNQPSVVYYFNCSSFLGVINVLVTTPMWVVNTRLKVQGTSRTYTDHSKNPIIYQGIIGKITNTCNTKKEYNLTCII